jgi:hypothetical protein
MLGLESLTKISIGFQSAIIYLPNTLAKAPECFKHRVHRYLSPASSAYLRILGNAICAQYVNNAPPSSSVLYVLLQTGFCEGVGTLRLMAGP